MLVCLFDCLFVCLFVICLICLGVCVCLSVKSILFVFLCVCLFVCFVNWLTKYYPINCFVIIILCGAKFTTSKIHFINVSSDSILQ